MELKKTNIPKEKIKLKTIEYPWRCTANDCWKIEEKRKKAKNIGKVNHLDSKEKAIVLE